MYKALLILSSSFLLAGCSLKDFFVKPPAGLEVATSSPATVFLNNANVGDTPYSDQKLKPDTYTLKLVPHNPDLSPYEVELKLTSKASTVISRSFASNDLDSSGYTLQLVEAKPDDTNLSIISDPDLVSVNLDGVPHGFTPLSKLATTPGAHSLEVSSPGYASQQLNVTAVKGYNLIANFKLAGTTIVLSPTTSPPATASASVQPGVSPSPTTSARPLPSPTALVAKPYVEIGVTETGWLRVRQDPSSTSPELGKASQGEKLPYLGVTTDLGWHKVEFEGQPGYVSAKYSTLVQ